RKYSFPLSSQSAACSKRNSQYSFEMQTVRPSPGSSAVSVQPGKNQTLLGPHSWWPRVKLNEELIGHNHSKNIGVKVNPLRNISHNVELIGGTQIDVEVFELHRPILHQHRFDAYARRPAGARICSGNPKSTVPSMHLSVSQT